MAVSRAEPRAEPAEAVESPVDVWYVLVHVVEGRTATVLLTLRVAESLTHDPGRYDLALTAAERATRRALSQRKQRHQALSGTGEVRYARADTVVTLLPVRVGRETDAAT